MRYAKAPAHIRGAIRAQADRWVTVTDAVPLAEILDAGREPGREGLAEDTPEPGFA